ncbi:CPBP family intramembrane metalloprotease domain-containing protein [Arthrobacter pityocampae]|uniref:CPBP family intramembrane metalloprotease domain-containing protein n=1 Tax=Arthrobacter pityocampae TaxID=547334 RepID=A0A2S5IYN1_9MICC|nr:type II CAAX endopeptidase family protein [Arthrobacter pityocampae]PPB49716.1 CPBP family intramembrane metalloprotease domain-containing protein [Arthrobacter pityocampae]
MHQVDQQFAFHRLARSWPRHRWWRPLLTALLGGVFYVVLLLLALVTGLALASLTPAGVGPYFDALSVLDLSNPVMFAFTLVSLILMIPALALATLIVGPRPLGLLSSVAGRIRWGWLALCAGVAVAVFLVNLAVSFGVGVLFPAEAEPLPVPPETSTLIVLLALSLLAVPFQAAAEEYVFRGFLMQAIGSWLRHPAFAILLPVPLFVLGHGYDPLGQADVAVFAIFAGWITWRTGGLEAAIAVHAINNMTIFALGAFGLVDVNSTEGSLSGLVLSMATMAVTAVVIVRLADSRGITRTRTVTVWPALEPANGIPGPALPPRPATDTDRLTADRRPIDG